MELNMEAANTADNEISEEIREDKKKGGWILQAIKFGIVGLVNTFVSYGVYTFCYYVLGTNEHVGNIMGFIISVFNAWIWQSKFVFKEDESGEKRVWWKVLIKTYISYSFTGLFLTEMLLIFWLNILSIQDHLGSVMDWVNGFGIITFGNTYDFAVSLAPFLNMVITIPINFVMNKFWAYRQKGKKPEEDLNENDKPA
ncbi:MAG: GtrA family protein [Clostridiales bacterium]|nr:GtrA family protein [Clostridiales bacterium]